MEGKRGPQLKAFMVTPSHNTQKQNNRSVLTTIQILDLL